MDFVTYIFINTYTVMVIAKLLLRLLLVNARCFLKSGHVTRTGKFDMLHESATLTVDVVSAAQNNAHVLVHEDP